MKTRKSVRIKQDDSGRANIFGVSIQALGGDKIKIRDDVYELTNDL